MLLNTCIVLRACLFTHANTVTAVTTWLADRRTACLAAQTATVDSFHIAQSARDAAHGVSVVYLERIIVCDQQLATEEFFRTLVVLLLCMRLFTALGRSAAAALAVGVRSTVVATDAALSGAGRTKEAWTSEAQRLRRHHREQHGRKGEDNSNTHL